jgi:uncharacterized protein (DUF1684 family)
VTRRFLAALLLVAGAAAAEGYVEDVQAWQQKREANLRADGGWLTVEGLFWLKPGDTPFGSDAKNTIRLPGSSPARAGVISFANGETRFRLAPGVAGHVGGQPVTEGVLRPDSEDVLVLGSVTLQAIERVGETAIRMKDNESPRRRAFKGLEFYPVQEKYRVEARFVAYDPPRTLDVANVTGQVNHFACPGYVEFELGGQKLRLEPVLESADASELFYIFRDETAPRDTYGAGRFLYSAMPVEGRVTLDFNKAYSPPCAFTPYATCPLPPKQNRLPLRIEAGERDPKVLH